MSFKPAWLNRNVILTSCTSFFTDISSEMIYPLLQSFVSMTLAGSRALIGPMLGIIEGIAESTASLLKVFAGYYSDRIRSRKLPAVSGYALSALAKALLFLANLSWFWILLSRFSDRVGKGIRSAPRDALISESVKPEHKGSAFGFQRAMDFAGASLGVVICYFLIRYFEKKGLLAAGGLAIRDISVFYKIFLVSIIPAFIGVFFLLFLKETAGASAPDGKARPKPNLDIRRYDRRLKIFFLAQFIFTLGNSSNQFLLLRSSTLGTTLANLLIMYLLFNLTATLFSTWFGSWSDRIGRINILAVGYILYAIVYIAFGFIGEGQAYLLWGFWILYGLFYAMTEGVEKALVTDLAPPESRATALGFWHTLAGIGLLPASLLAGILFTLSGSAPFICGGLLSLSASLVIIFGVRN